MELKDCISLSIASAALALSLWNFISQKRSQKMALHVSWNKEILSWSIAFIKECGVVISIIERLKVGGYEKEIMTNIIVSRQNISHFLDVGRLFFPNIKHDEVGQHKEGAFRGKRQLVLDCVYGVFSVLCRDFSKVDEKDLEEVVWSIVKCRRHFVSEIQSKIGTRYLEKNAVVGVHKHKEGGRV